MTDQNRSPNLPIPTELHGNIAPNIHNLESTDNLKQHLIDNNREMAQHYKEAAVSLSDFKPTQNVWKGNEKDLDSVLTSGDLGKDKFFTSAFERQSKGSFFEEGDHTLHGNKGKNLGNLESTELNNTMKDKQRDVATHYHDANVKLSDFKPTQNIQKGHERELDKVLVSGDLGADKFFTKAFERQAKGTTLGESGEFRDATVLHGNKGLNISNMESREMKDTFLHKHEEMEAHYKEANVKLSDFKPTQNIQKGHEKDLDKVLIAGDLGDDKFFKYAFDQQAKGGIDDENRNLIHGNKGKNLGNLESEEMRQHVVDNNRKMAEHYKEANVTLSDFKPTQNIQKGHEKDLDKVLIAGDLGKDTFFTKAFENQVKVDESKVEGGGHGNKGINVSNLTSVDYIENLAENMERGDRNVKNSHIYGDSFKPNHDIFVGHNMAREKSNQEAFKGQSLEQVLEEKGPDMPSA